MYQVVLDSSVDLDPAITKEENHLLPSKLISLVTLARLKM
jgi:hypothetical protein